MRSIGIPGVHPPPTPCKDIDCPFHGTLSIRGKILEGKVVSVKRAKTVTVLREYLHYVPKYKRYERRRSKISAHLPPCISVSPGDTVIVGECRKIAKTVSFCVVGKKE